MYLLYCGSIAVASQPQYVVGVRRDHNSGTISLSHHFTLRGSRLLYTPVGSPKPTNVRQRYYTRLLRISLGRLCLRTDYCTIPGRDPCISKQQLEVAL